MAKKSAPKPAGTDASVIEQVCSDLGIEHWGITFSNGQWHLFKVSANVKPVATLGKDGWEA